MASLGRNPSPDRASAIDPGRNIGLVPLLGLENPMHSEDCADLEAKGEDTESEVKLGNDQQPRKLQNSQILNDLSTKQSHIMPVFLVQGYWQVPITQ